MKNINYILSGLLISMTVSCNVLDEEVVSGVTGEFYNTPEGFQAAVDAAYEPLRTYYADEQGTTLTVFGTDEFTNGGHGNYHYMNQYTAALNSESAPIWRVWSNFYEAINICNTVVSRAEEAGFPQEEINLRVGEVRFLR